MRWTRRGGCGDCGCSERTGAAVARRNAASTPCNRARTPSCARSDHFWKIPVSNRSSRPQNRQFGPRRADGDHFYVFSGREGSFQTILFVRFRAQRGLAARETHIGRGLAALEMCQAWADSTWDVPDAGWRHAGRTSRVPRPYASPMICMANSATVSPPTMATVAHSTMRRGSLAR